MRDFRDAKAMATSLKEELFGRKIELKLSECLEITAKQFGCKDWNVLAAAIQKTNIPITDQQKFKLPGGWIKTGQAAFMFEAGVDPSVSFGVHPVVTILRRDRAETDAAVDGFATVMQSVAAENYIEKRVRFSAYIKVRDVLGSATIWVRVDNEHGRTIAFNNLETQAKDGALAGSSDWVQRDIVLTVPVGASSLNFGFYLQGTGQAWFAGLTLDEAAKHLVETKSQLATHPVNLGFVSV